MGKDWRRVGWKQGEAAAIPRGMEMDTQTKALTRRGRERGRPERLTGPRSQSAGPRGDPAKRRTKPGVGGLLAGAPRGLVLSSVFNVSCFQSVSITR